MSHKCNKESQYNFKCQYSILNDTNNIWYAMFYLRINDMIPKSEKDYEIKELFRESFNNICIEYLLHICETRPCRYCDRYRYYGIE